MRTLLLDKQYKPISFIGHRRMARLVVKEKATVVSTWKGESFHGDLDYPSIIVLNHYVRKKPLLPRFNFRGVFRRDFYTCQYTGIILPPTQLDRKSTRLNSSHVKTSYAVFCLNK